MESFCADSEFKFHHLLCVLDTVKFAAAAAFAAGGDVGDILSVIGPDQIVAAGVHSLFEISLSTGDAHALVNDVHHSQLPTLTLDGGAVLPAAHAIGVFLGRSQN